MFGGGVGVEGQDFRDVENRYLRVFGLVKEWGYFQNMVLQQGNQGCQVCGFCVVIGFFWFIWCLDLFFLYLVVEFLVDIVQNCSLEDLQIEKERDVILQELQENDAFMRDVVFDYLYVTVFQGIFLVQVVEGFSENVR